MKIHNFPHSWCWWS